MESDGEAVRLVPDYLNQMQHRRVVVQGDRSVFLPQYINDLFAFGYGCYWLGGDLQRFQRFGGDINCPKPPSIKTRLGKGRFSSCRRL